MIFIVLRILIIRSPLYFIKNNINHRRLIDEEASSGREKISIEQTAINTTEYHSFI